MPLVLELYIGFLAAIALAIVGPRLWDKADDVLLWTRRRRWDRLSRPGFPVITKERSE